MHKLVVARLIKGYNQQQFADAVGISKMYLYKIEKKQQIPSRKVMSKIATVLGKKIEQIEKMFKASARKGE